MSWKYFSYEGDPRLKCACCGKEAMQDSFMEKLDKVRDRLGKPVIITSGYRCPYHNGIVSHTGPNGAHTTGLAADIAIPNGKYRYHAIWAAMAVGINRIGIGEFYLHLDSDPYKHNGVIFLSKGAT